MSYYNLISLMPKLDPDAQAFITAASITNPTQQSAINQLVVDLKGYNIWTKMKALYPIIGGVASSHAVNLKTPGTFNLTFATGWTHSATGMTPLNTYADTFLIPNSQLSLNSTHISGYVRNNLSTNAPILSAEDAVTYNNGLYIWPRWNAPNQYSIRINDNTSQVGTSTDSRGFHIISRTASNSKKYYKNNTIIFSLTTVSTGLNASSIYIGSSRNNANFSLFETAFASIGDGLTDTEAANFYTAVQAYQTTLGRQV